MSLLRVGRPFLRLSCTPIDRIVHSGRQIPVICSLTARYQTRARHSDQRPISRTNPYPSPQQANVQGREIPPKDNDVEYVHYSEPEDEFPDIKVRYLRPAIWAVSVSAGFYVFLAYLQAKDEMKPRSVQQYVPQWNVQRRTPPTPIEIATRAWDNLNPIAKVSFGLIATNGAVHLSSFLPRSPWGLLWHMPARNVNYTLLTSTFVHSGIVHLGVNMWACSNFLIPVGYSKLFEGNPYHTLSFFLSAGVISGFAQHFATMFHRRGRRGSEIFIRSGGASGALFAVFGAFCMQYPDAGVGLLLVPYYIAAQNFLPLVMLFDLYGVVRGYSFVNLGHAAHLGGAMIGIGYSYFDGNKRLWKPLVRFWKKRLQQQN